MDPVLSASDYNQLRAFATVGELLSFSRAADALGVSPSALSQTVRALEDRIGTRLFNRTTRSVALTDAGEILLGRIRPAVAELGDAITQARRAGERPTGIVRVHAFRSGGERYLQPILGRFAADFPDVVLDVTLDDAVEDMVAGGYDVAIRIGEVIERDMIAVRLGPALRQIAVASPAYIARWGRPEHPRDLLDHRCIRWRWPGRPTPYAWEFFEHGAWFEVAVNGPLIVNDKDLAVSGALQDAGIAFAVEETVNEPIGSGALTPLLEPWCASFPGYFLCYSGQRQMAPALRAFIDTVRDGATSKQDDITRRSTAP